MRRWGSISKLISGENVEEIPHVTLENVKNNLTPSLKKVKMLPYYSDPFKQMASE